MREYTTPTRAAKVVEMKVDDRVISWTKPKDAVVALPILEAQSSNDPGAAATANVKALFDWLGQGLSSDDEQWLEDRLRDPADNFDMEDLNAIVETLSEEAATVPPTSPSDSGQQPVPTG